jgi:mono/diheme cytochrome c family protein
MAKMNQRIAFKGMVFVAALAAFSVVNSAETPPASFARRIQPILDANCVACHQTGSAQQGLILEAGSSYRNLVGKKSQQSSLDLVHPGAADLSYLVHKLRGSQLSMHGSGAQMPLGGSLEASDLEAIISWIESGARDN